MSGQTDDERLAEIRTRCEQLEARQLRGEWMQEFPDNTRFLLDYINRQAKELDHETTWYEATRTDLEACVTERNRLRAALEGLYRRVPCKCGCHELRRQGDYAGLRQTNHTGWCHQHMDDPHNYEAALGITEGA